MATPSQDLSAFFAERGREHREYVNQCVQLADKVSDAFKSHLGPNAKLDGEPLKPAAGQTTISRNGVLQDNGVAIFAYQVEIDAPESPPHAITFFISAGKLRGDGERKPEHAPSPEWFVGHEKENFGMLHGGSKEDLEPVIDHIVNAVRLAIEGRYPIEARQPEEKRAEGGEKTEGKAEGKADPKADGKTEKVEGKGEEQPHEKANGAA
jgi:hypothetical protein